jgi:hypothetical protein
MSFFFVFYTYKLEFYLDVVVDIKERKVSSVVEQI